MIDPHDTMKAQEVRDFARVIRRAIGVVIAFWTNVQHLPPQHPYRQAARMIESYLEDRYGV